MDADPHMTPVTPSADHCYQLDCPTSEVPGLIEQTVVPTLGELGYVVDARSDSQLTMLGMRRPRWAVALAIFLFPIGLLLLLIKRPSQVRLEWGGSDPVTLGLSGADPAATHAVAAIAVERERPPSSVEVASVPFIVGAASILFGWLAAVQLVEGRLAFILSVCAAAVFGCGIGTLIGMHRASRSEDPRNPIVWGALPALAGAVAMTVLFVGLVLFLLAIGAGD